MTSLLALTLTMQMSWTKLADIPDPEGFAAPFAGVSHARLIVAGGANFPGKKPWEGGEKIWYDTVFALDEPGGAWRVAGKLPRPLGYGVSVTHGSRVVCVGGSDAVRHFADTFSIELVGSQVETRFLSPLPVLMANGSGALVGDVLYVAGGQERATSTSASEKVFSLDLRDRKAEWVEVPAFPGSGRILATAAGFDGAFWIMGGASLAADAKGNAVRTYLRDVYRFRPSDGWKRMADLPYPVVAAPSPAPTDGSSFYVLGGDDGSLVGTSPTAHPGFPRKVLRYDAPSDRWVEAGEMPAGRVTVPTAEWRGRWIIPNGEQRPGVRSPEVWSLGLR